MELFTTTYFRSSGRYHCQAFLQSPFTRETNWVRTRGKCRTDCMILSVKTENNFPRVGQKFSIAQRFEGCVYTTPLATGSIFSMGVHYWACDQRNYYTS